MSERRKFMRFNVLMDVMHTIFGNTKEKCKACAKDLSKDGVRLSGASEIKEGTELELELKIPGDNMPVLALGKVAWSTRVDRNRYDHGVHFKRIDNYDRARLLDYVYNEWIRGKKDVK